MEVTKDGILFPNPFNHTFTSVVNTLFGKSNHSNKISPEHSVSMRKILIIEDSKPFRRLVEFILTKANYEVMSATDGFEAIYKLSEGEVPDLIISDIEMPNFTGEELIHNLFNSGLFSHIPIIILTGLDSEEVKKKCLASGAFAFLNKPFDPSDLLKYIEEALDNSEATVQQRMKISKR
jgi:two-component system, chemotaxis family, chemotaxis protein CheY